MSTRLVRGAVILAVLAGGAYLALRLLAPPPPAEQQIQDLILHAAAAVEERRVGKLMGLIAEDYQDGVYTKADLRQIARRGLIGPEQVRVTPYLRGLMISEGTATALVEAEVVIGAPPTEISRERYTVQLALRQEGRRWLVYSAQGWQAASQQLSPPGL